MTDVATTFWEQQASKPWGAYITDVERELVLSASREAGAPTVALEVGCDGGRWSKLLTDSGWRMICTDVNERTLALCRSRLPTATCILTRPDDTALPCDTASVDLLLCIEVFPVIPQSWFISEAKRVLKPGGHLVGVFNNKRSARGYLHALIASARHASNYYVRSYVDWRHEAAQQGFEMVREVGLCWFPVPRTSASRVALVLTELERRLGLRRLVSASPWVVFQARKRRDPAAETAAPNAAPR
jgi:SAM-dependent methyltransferase